MDDLHFGVHEDMMYALATPSVPGAQWTGIVTQIAIQMLESRQVEAVVCVQSDEHDRFTPKPVRCRDLLTIRRAQLQTAWPFDSRTFSQCIAILNLCLRQQAPAAPSLTAVQLLLPCVCSLLS